MGKPTYAELQASLVESLKVVKKLSERCDRYEELLSAQEELLAAQGSELHLLTEAIRDKMIRDEKQSSEKEARQKEFFQREGRMPLYQ
jgi:hypothetical protein